MKSGRRSFLKIAGATALGLGIKPVFDVFAVSEEKASPQILNDEKSLAAKQWAMVVDTRKIHSIEDIQRMASACHHIHNVPDLKNKNMQR